MKKPAFLSTGRKSNGRVLALTGGDEEGLRAYNRQQEVLRAEDVTPEWALRELRYWYRVFKAQGDGARCLMTLMRIAEIQGWTKQKPKGPKAEKSDPQDPEAAERHLMELLRLAEGGDEP